MKYSKKEYNKAFTKECASKSRKGALSAGGKKMKGGKTPSVTHGKDAKVVGHN